MYVWWDWYCAVMVMLMDADVYVLCASGILVGCTPYGVDDYIAE
jgi:hypothetical protein